MALRDKNTGVQLIRMTQNGWKLSAVIYTCTMHQGKVVMSVLANIAHQAGVYIQFHRYSRTDCISTTPGQDARPS